jgi:hypothetical protein
LRRRRQLAHVRVPHATDLGRPHAPSRSSKPDQ